jgi:hypothetical protein
VSKKDGNGDEVPEATPSKLESILIRARLREAKEAQEKHAGDRKAIERARLARVRARDEKKGGGKK